MDIKRFFADVDRLARTLPWHTFVAEYVVAFTARADERWLVGGYKVWKVGDRYVWAMGVRAGRTTRFTPAFAPCDASTAYGWFERSPLVYFARKADALRDAILAPPADPRAPRTIQSTTTPDTADTVDAALCCLRAGLARARATGCEDVATDTFAPPFGLTTDALEAAILTRGDVLAHALGIGDVRIARVANVPITVFVRF